MISQSRVKSLCGIAKNYSVMQISSMLQRITLWVFQRHYLRQSLCAHA